MKRSVIRKLGRLLPVGIRERAKRHYLGQSIENVRNRFTLEETPGAMVCRVDDAFSFSAPKNSRSDLEHYTTSFEGRAEFAALAQAAGDRAASSSISAPIAVTSPRCGAPRNRAIAPFASNLLLLNARLREIRELNQFGDRMEINQVAIGEVPGTAEMLIDSVGGFVQSRHFDHTMWSAPKAIEVTIESVAIASARLNVIPDFIKLDIEGYEYEAIKGAVSFLTEYRPALFLELHLNYLEERKLSARSVVDLLEQCGYSFFTYRGAKLRAADVYGSPLAIQHVVVK
jgi:methyltransferase, FkbM family